MSPKAGLICKRVWQRRQGYLYFWLKVVSLPLCKFQITILFVTLSNRLRRIIIIAKNTAAQHINELRKPKVQNIFVVMQDYNVLQFLLKLMPNANSQL